MYNQPRDTIVVNKPLLGFKQKTLVQAISVALVSTLALPALADFDSSVELPQITIEGQGLDSYKVDRADSFKYSQPLLETPKTLTIIPESVMKDRGIDNLRDALRSVPGISMAAGEGGVPTGDSMTIRGFSARTDIFVDGIRDIAGYSRDIYNTEAIEVSKGPGSSVTGRGSVGGSINLVRKSARLDSFTDVGTVLGSENDYRLTLDTNHRFGENSAFRINALTTDAEVAGRDEIENKMDAIALSVATGIDTGTRFKFSAEYQDQDRVPDFGLPWVPNYSDRSDREIVDSLKRYSGGPAPVSFDNFYGNVHRDFEDIKAYNFIGLFEQDLTDSSMLFVQAKYGVVERNSVMTAPRFTFTTIGGVRLYGGDGITLGSEKTRDQENIMKALQVAYVASANTGRFSHEFSIGAEYYIEQEERWEERDNGTDNLQRVSQDMHNPNPSLPYAGSYDRVGPSNKAESKTLAFYVFDTITINPKWEVSAGLRYENYESETHDDYDDPSSKLSRDDDMVSWNLGVVYKVRENGMVYAAGGTSFNPAAEDLTASNRGNEIYLKPEKSISFEIGTKWELFDEKLLVTAALFRTEKTDARSDDPFRGDSNSRSFESRAETLDGEQRVTGLELSAYGQITPQLSIAGGYVYQDSKIVKATGDDAAFIGADLARTPKHSITLWSTYDFSEKLSLGFGAEYVGEQYNSFRPGSREQADSYTLVDAMAAYKFNDDFSLQFNANNITDKRYASLLGGGHFVPGPGRYFSLGGIYSF